MGLFYGRKKINRRAYLTIITSTVNKIGNQRGDFNFTAKSKQRRSPSNSIAKSAGKRRNKPEYGANCIYVGRARSIWEANWVRCGANWNGANSLRGETNARMRILRDAQRTKKRSITTTLDGRVRPLGLDRSTVNHARFNAQKNPPHSSVCSGR